MIETFPGAAALASYMRSGGRDDRTAYRSLPDEDRAAYRRLVEEVLDGALVRHFGDDRSKASVDRLIASAAKRHPGYSGSIAKVLRAHIGERDRLRELTPRQLLTAQHLVLREIAEHRPELRIEAELAVAAGIARAATAIPAKAPAPERKPAPRPEKIEAAEPEPPSEEDERVPSPADFSLPESYEAQIEEARAFMRHIPPGPGLEAAQKILDAAPSREQMEELQRRAAEGRSMVERVEAARYEGTDAEGTVLAEVDASGRLCRLDMDPAVVAKGNRELAACIANACRAADERREAARADLLADASTGAQNPGDADILKRIEEAMAEAGNDRYEHTPASELCRVEVDRRGALTDLTFLTGNVARALEREDLADRVREAVQAAQREASRAVGAMTAELLRST